MKMIVDSRDQFHKPRRWWKDEEGRRKKKEDRV